MNIEIIHVGSFFKATVAIAGPVISISSMNLEFSSSRMNQGMCLIDELCLLESSLGVEGMSVMVEKNTTIFLF